MIIQRKCRPLWWPYIYKVNESLIVSSKKIRTTIDEPTKKIRPVIVDRSNWIRRNTEYYRNHQRKCRPLAIDHPKKIRTATVEKIVGSYRLIIKVNMDLSLTIKRLCKPIHLLLTDSPQKWRFGPLMKVQISSCWPSNQDNAFRLLSKKIHSLNENTDLPSLQKIQTSIDSVWENPDINRL